MPSDYSDENKVILEAKNSTIPTCNINNILFSTYLFTDNSNCDHEYNNYENLTIREYQNFKFSKILNLYHI